MRTRLAPSPTGALHLGNARTFLVNWALARQQGQEPGIVQDRSRVDARQFGNTSLHYAVDFVFGRSPMCGSEFARAGQFPFPGLNYFAVPTGTEVRRLR